MGKATASKNWGAIGIVSVSGGLGLNGSGTIYLWRNGDNDEKFLFMLADVGLGGTFGINIKKLHILVKKVLGIVTAYDPRSYTTIPCNKSFSADDLNLARGAEATIGVTLLAGYSYTVISGWPMFGGAPDAGGEPVNNDYFSGADVSGIQAGLGLGAAYRFLGGWGKLWSF